VKVGVIFLAVLTICECDGQTNRQMDI